MKAFSRLLLSACALWIGSGHRAQAQTYTFTTIAGQAGVSGSTDGTNGNARFNFPSEITVDDNGVVYVSDLSNHTIRQLTPVGTNWVVTTLAGMPGAPGSADGTNSDARFYNPNGIAVDGAGNLFVADHYSQTIRKLTRIGTNWVVTTLAGLAGARGGEDGTNSSARFYSPTGIAVDGADNLYVVDTANFTVRKVAPEGTNWVVTTIAGTALNYGFLDGVNDAAEFDYPYSIALGIGGVLYITDWGNNAIREITPVGPDWVTTTISGFSSVMGTNDGPASTASFNGPNGIAVDAATNVYVADQANSTIRKVAPGASDWTVSTVAGAPGQRGSTNGVGSVARFNKPWGITVDDAGTLYVVDYLNHTIRMGLPSSIPTPTLRLARGTNQVVISWPAAATDYMLETSPVVSAGAVWSPLTNGLVVSGNKLFLTNALGASPAFFRLRKQ